MHASCRPATSAARSLPFALQAHHLIIPNRPPTCQHQLLQGDQLGQPVQVSHICDPVASQAEVLQTRQLVQAGQAAQAAARQAQMAQPVAACSAASLVYLQGQVEYSPEAGQNLQAVRTWPQDRRSRACRPAGVHHPSVVGAADDSLQGQGKAAQDLVA